MPSEAVPLPPVRVAVMVTVPPAIPVAKPELLIVASAVFDDVHVTPLVSVFVEPLLYWPVAVNCTEPWIEMPGGAGVTAIDVNVAVPPPLETFKFAVALTPLIEAVITAVP